MDKFVQNASRMYQVARVALQEFSPGNICAVERTRQEGTGWTGGETPCTFENVVAPMEDIATCLAP